MLNDSLIAVTVLMLIGSLLLRQGPLFAAALALLLSAVTSRLWGRYCLEGVEYHRRLSERRVFFGETVDIAIQIVNRKLLPLAWLQIEDEFPAAVPLASGQLEMSHLPHRGTLSSVLSLRWYEQVTRRYTLRAMERGYHAFGPARLRSGDLFGFAIKEAVLPAIDYLLVYPRILPLEALGLPARQLLGNLRTRQQIFEDPSRTIGVREYVYGDNPRRVHWKATARAQQLQVKVYEPTTTVEAIIFLNVNTVNEDWQGIMPDLLELVITVAASVASWAVEEGFMVGLYANASVWHSHELVHLPPSRDPDQLTHVLEALAKVVPFLTSHMEELLRAESAGLPWGATAIVITATVSDEMLAGLHSLQTAGHPVALVLVGDEAAGLRIQGIPTYRIGGEGLWRELQQIQLA